MNIAASVFKAPSGAYGDIVEKFVDNASFLWILRSIAVGQPHYYLNDIRQLDQRIEAQLDGLMTALEQSWQACLEALEYQQPGEDFVAAMVAFKSRDPQKIQLAVEAGLSGDLAAGLISALGWLQTAYVDDWISSFLSSKDLNHKYLAIAACSVRRENPGEVLAGILQREDCRQHIKLYARALRLIGELKRRDLQPLLQTAMQSEIDAIRFWSYWSASLMGDQSAVYQLKKFVLEAGPFQAGSIDVCFRLLPIEEARSWISELGNTDGQIRAVINASAVLGDPHALEWLIARMEQTEVCRLAGEAFSQISGIGIDQSGLALEMPAPAFEEEDIEEADGLIMQDENLPWPDVDKIKAIWARHRANFVPGQRYFMGKPISSELLRNSLSSANQRQRKAAALELALMEPDMQVANIEARS